MITTTTTTSSRNRLSSRTTLLTNAWNTSSFQRSVILLSLFMLILSLCINQRVDDVASLLFPPSLFCFGFPIIQQIISSSSSSSFVTNRNTKFKNITSLLHSTTSNNINNNNNHNQRQTIISRRWNGNYKHSSKKLCDVPKRKKLQLDLQVKGKNGDHMYTKKFVKTKEETLQHVLTKAMIWALFIDKYPNNLQIEYDIGDPNYLPDVVSFVNVNNVNTTTSESDSDDHDDIASSVEKQKQKQLKQPLFWGESGRMKVSKAITILQRYPNTHFVHCRWGMPNQIDSVSEPLEVYLQEQYDLDLLDLRLVTQRRTAPFEFCHIPYDVWRYIDETTKPMTINITKQDLQWKQLQFPSTKSNNILIQNDE